MVQIHPAHEIVRIDSAMQVPGDHMARDYEQALGIIFWEALQAGTAIDPSILKRGFYLREHANGYYVPPQDGKKHSRYDETFQAKFNSRGRFIRPGDVAADEAALRAAVRDIARNLRIKKRLPFDTCFSFKSVPPVRRNPIDADYARALFTRGGKSVQFTAPEASMPSNSFPANWTAYFYDTHLRFASDTKPEDHAMTFGAPHKWVWVVARTQVHYCYSNGCWTTVEVKPTLVRLSEVHNWRARVTAPNFDHLELFPIVEIKKVHYRWVNGPLAVRSVGNGLWEEPAGPLAPADKCTLPTYGTCRHAPAELEGQLKSE